MDNYGSTLRIPVKYNEDYHELIEDYNYTKNLIYTIQFTNKVNYKHKRVVRIILPKKSEDYITFKEYDNILGVDVNTKHNLFMLSDGTIFDYHRPLLEKYIKFLDKDDKKKENKRKHKQEEIDRSKQDQYKHDKWLRRMEWMMKYITSKMVKYVKENNYDTIVMEDLFLTSKTRRKKKKDEISKIEDIRQSRLNRILHLSSLKRIITNKCLKEEIDPVTIHSAYTSKTCSKCGSLNGTRDTQETFICNDCRNEINADYNASVNIANRFKNINLRKALLNLKDGLYIPKKISLEDIKRTLLEAYCPNKYKVNPI